MRMPSWPTTTSSPWLDRSGGDHARLGCGGVDDDDQIHLGVLHLDPAAVEADLRGQVGGGVEIGREDAVGGRGLAGYVVARGQDGAEGLQGQEDGFQLALAVGMNLEAGEGGLVLGAADLDFLDVEGAAHVHDGVKGAGEGPGVDDVSFEGNFFTERMHDALVILWASLAKWVERVFKKSIRKKARGRCASGPEN